MPEFNTGDVVKYVGENLKQQEGVVKDIKIFCSERTGRPIYSIIWREDVEPYQYGIFEHNLILVKKVAPDWEV